MRPPARIKSRSRPKNEEVSLAQFTPRQFAAFFFQTGLLKDWPRLTPSAYNIMPTTIQLAS
jgi:hypothetical protein